MIASAAEDNRKSIHQIKKNKRENNMVEPVDTLQFRVQLTHDILQFRVVKGEVDGQLHLVRQHPLLESAVLGRVFDMVRQDDQQTRRTTSARQFLQTF
jgi:hypothetical protein